MVTISALGVIKTNKRQTCANVVKTIHDLDVHGEVGTSCRLWELRPSRLWKALSEGTEEVEVGRRFIQRLYGGRRNEKGQDIGSVPGTVTVFPQS